MWKGPRTGDFALLKGVQLTAVIVLFIFSQSASALPLGIDVNIVPAKSIITKADSIQLTVTYRNVTQTTIKLLTRGTALEGRIVEDLFIITNHSGRVAYDGPLVKRLPIKENEFVYISPDEELSATVSLDGIYPFSETGDYAIRYQGTGHNKLTNDNAVIINVLDARPTTKQTPSFQSCNTTEQQRSNSALSVAESYANRARSDMRATPISLRSSARRYREWFGSYSEQRWNKVDQNIARIASTLNNRTITFDCACSANVDRGNTIAYVYRSQPYRIHLCPIFWQIPGTGVDSKAGTIIHEVSHFGVVANTDDHTYGLSATRNLANSSPDRAIANAESYQYFAENPRNLSMPTGPSVPTPPGDPNPGGDPNDPGNNPPSVEPVFEPDYSYLPSIINAVLTDDASAPPPYVLPNKPYPHIPSDFNGQFAIVVEGEAGNPLLDEKKYIHTQENSNLTKISVSHNGVHFLIEGGEATGEAFSELESLSIEISAANGHSLVRGYYSLIADLYHHEHPYIRIMVNNTRCEQSEGSLRVYDYRSSGFDLQRLLADLSFSCEGSQSKFRMAIDIDSTRDPVQVDYSGIPTTPPSPDMDELTFSDAKVHIERTTTDGLEKLEFSIGDYMIDAHHELLSHGIKVYAVNADESWSMTFRRGELDADVLKGEPLRIGTYSNAVAQSSSEPAPYIRVTSDDTQCSQYRGEFRVFDIDYAGQYKAEINRLKLSFTQYCDDSEKPIRGTIYIDKTLPSKPFTQPNEVPENHIFRPQQPELLSAGARLVFEHPGREPEIWDTTTATLEVRHSVYGGTDHQFIFFLDRRHGSIHIFKKEDLNDDLNKGRFVPGVYPIPTSSRNTSVAGLRYSGELYSCLGDQKGELWVHRADYDGDNKVQRFDADFRFKCGGEDEDHFGSIRFRSD